MNESHAPGYAAAVLALAALLLTNALLGPIGVGLLDYPLPTSLFNQLVGLELVTVILVVPTLAAAAALAHCGHPAAPLLGIGACGYAAYMFAQYVVGPARTSYSPAVLIQLVVFSAATALSVWSWSLARRTAWPRTEAHQRRRWGLLLVGLASFVLLRYLPLFVGSAKDSAIPREFAEAPAFFWSIVLLDLGVGRTDDRRCRDRCCARLTPSRFRPRSPWVGWFALVPPSVAAMAAVMVVRDDPYASVPTLVLLAVTSVITTGLAVHMFTVSCATPVCAVALGLVESGWSTRCSPARGRIHRRQSDDLAPSSRCGQGPRTRSWWIHGHVLACARPARASEPAT